METDNRTIYYGISLESAVARRQRLTRQAEAAGIDLHIVPACVGAELTEAEMAGYDRAKRKKTHSEALKPGEIGCLLSHLKVLRMFVESGAPYAVILEDDADFAPNAKETVEYITRHTEGWGVVKLFAFRGKAEDVSPADLPADAPVRFIFPRKIYWVTAAILYTREAAQKVLELCGTYWMAWDAQLSYLLMEHGIPYCAVSPAVIDTCDAGNAESTIENRATKKKYDNVFQYIRRRWSVLHASLRKKAMCKLVKKQLRTR